MAHRHKNDVNRFAIIICSHCHIAIILTRHLLVEQWWNRTRVFVFLFKTPFNLICLQPWCNMILDPSHISLLAFNKQLSNLSRNFKNTVCTTITVLYYCVSVCLIHPNFNLRFEHLFLFHNLVLSTYFYASSRLCIS